jgi:isocitrate dehydrogenase
VNPVLREGNSDRRAPKAVKNFAKQTLILWVLGLLIQNKSSKWKKVIFYGSEKSYFADATDVKEFVAKDGTTTVLKRSLSQEK